ncbi:hypothetical protein BDZ91DRAFT_538208 [Kalaharituber pfeilii]|nr:hypothetical protein BDZ91DRAFT_538208 [Kalaharituber pfeilii]
MTPSSYPFPTMPIPRHGLSPSTAGPHDRAIPSGSATPSSFAFMPAGTNPTTPYENPDFPTPNMYELALRLHSEPGIEAFWSNLVKICITYYKAERLSLAVPTDSTDLENTPWGQKATYFREDNDDLSLTYLGADGGIVGDIETEETEEEESDDQTGVPISEEVKGHCVQSSEEKADTEAGEEYSSMDESPLQLESSPDQPFSPITIGIDTNLADTSSNSEWISDGEAISPTHSPGSTNGPGFKVDQSGLDLQSDQENPLTGRVFPILQPLSYEADALLDGAGVIRVLQRGKTVVLSREYRDIQTHMGGTMVEKRKHDVGESQHHTPWSTNAILPEGSPTDTGAKKEKMHISLSDLPPPPTPGHPPSEPPTPLPFISRNARRKGKEQRQKQKNKFPANVKYFSSIQHQLHHSRSHSPSHSLYEEYEQPLSSPWSQSPAPSPAIKPDPSENPFFVPPKVDEDTFNPVGSSPVYSAQEPVHAIGLESASTVIHIPLVHPSISKSLHNYDTLLSPQDLQMNRTSLPRKGKPMMSNDRSTNNGSIHHSAPHSVAGERKAPIAILSMLSPVIPYPSNLVHSLSHFAPLVATAFALAQAHDNLKTQLSNISYRRRLHSYSLGSFNTSNISPGRGSTSVTSPSTNSTFSRFSAATSRVPSPNTEGGLSHSRGVTDSSGLSSNPGTPSTESYFTAKHKLLKDVVSSKISSKSRSNVSCNGNSDPEWYHHREGDESAGSGTTVRDDRPKDVLEECLRVTTTNDAAMELSPAKLMSPHKISEGLDTKTDAGMPSPGLEVPRLSSNPSSESGFIRRIRLSRKGTSHFKGHKNHHLYSYGIDYTNTFNSLAVAASEPNTPRRRHSLATKPPQMSAMPPPPNDLLRNIIEWLPVHVFTAAPSTGVTTWVNSRMLSYCGSTVDEFLHDPWAPYHPEDREEYKRQWKMAVRAGRPFSQQVRIRRFDGQYRLFLIRAVPCRDSKGGIVHWFGTNMDVHDQRVAEINAARQQEMAESEHKYRSLANSSPQIVFACTANEGITFANTQWETYSGQTLENTLKLGFIEFVHPQDRKKCSLPGLGIVDGKQGTASECGPNPVQDSSKSEARSPGSKNGKSGTKLSTRIYEVMGEDGSDGTFSTELRLRRKDGEYRWHLVRCVRVESNFGNGEGQWFGTCTDINDHKLLEQKLKEANDAAQKTMESKTRFLANMSHEIRTPLIGISGMVNFLLDTTLSGEQLDYCHTISQSSEGLLMVINDILDLSKVEAGMMRLNSTWFRIHSLIEDANELLSTMAIQKQLELNYIVDEDVPLVVGGDRVRLRQVLLNVIGNAIKFTNTGEVFSRCSVHREATVGEDEIMLQFECHDTGPGFDKQEEELIFKPFSQIDGSSTRAHGGSGLGLVISRQLVELHGGTMSAKSVKGKGSLFMFTAIFKVPPHREEAGTAHTENIEEDHILDKGFTESLSNASATTNFGGAEASGGTSGPQERSFNTFLSPSEQLHVQRLSDSEVQESSIYSPTQLELEQATDHYIPAEGSTTDTSSKTDCVDLTKKIPPAFTILVVSKHAFSLIAICHHIRMTLPKTVPHQLDRVCSYDECLERLDSAKDLQYTHIVINLPEQSEVISLLRHVRESTTQPKAILVVLTNPVQRAAIIDGAAREYEEKGEGDRIQIINKPIKPSRLGFIFDPGNERDASMDRNRDSAQQVVEIQKRVFTEMEKYVGNKGHRVLLVEDNPVNQKVLLRFLARVGLEVETATDGEECVSKVFSNGSGHYALILCDLHMPRKDGFQACAEIRQWEKARKLPLVPIIALSANVMSDVLARCATAGFSRYVAKPVVFEILSKAIQELLNPENEHLLMNQQPQEVSDSALVGIAPGNPPPLFTPRLPSTLQSLPQPSLPPPTTMTPSATPITTTTIPHPSTPPPLASPISAQQSASAPSSPHAT